MMDACAQQIIIDRIDTIYWVFVAITPTANAMWISPKRVFEKGTKLMPAYAIMALFSHTLDKENESLDELLRFKQEQINDFHQFQGTVFDLIGLIHALALIKSLPESWS